MDLVFGTDTGLIYENCQPTAGKLGLPYPQQESKTNHERDKDPHGNHRGAQGLYRPAMVRTSCIKVYQSISRVDGDEEARKQAPHQAGSPHPYFYWRGRLPMLRKRPTV
jgi:hypothetical protein